MEVSQMENNEKVQQDFCKGALDSIQSLINRMDLKAGIILTIIGALSAGLYALLGVLTKCDLASLHGNWLLIVVIILYFLNIIYILWQTMSVFLARNATVGNYSQAPLMLYPLLILRAFKSDKDYAERAKQLTHNEIIADYANQVMECSNIYKLKHEHVNKAIKALGLLLLLWLAFIVIATWKIFL